MIKLTDDECAELRIVQNRIIDATRRVGDSDMMVATAEQSRAQARERALREAAELSATANRIAMGHGISDAQLKEEQWVFDPKLGALVSPSSPADA